MKLKKNEVRIDVAFALGMLTGKKAACLLSDDEALTGYVNESEHVTWHNNADYYLKITDHFRVELSVKAADSIGETVIAEFNLKMRQALLVEELAEAIIIYDKYLQEN